MYIDLCIVSSDLNKNYIGLYPFVKKAWGKLGVKTLLILVANGIPDHLIEHKDDIILFEPIENMHTAFQAQTVRLLYPALIPNKNIIVSDIDIIPLNKNYFIDNIKLVPNNSHIIFRDSYIKQNMYAVCYHLSNSNVWKNIFNISNIDEIRNTMRNWYNIEYSGEKNCAGWFTDQYMLYKYINQNISNSVVVLKDADMNFKRLDKREKKYIVDNKDTVLNDVQNNIYTDFHVIRPYQKHISLINNIIDSINFD